MQQSLGFSVQAMAIYSQMTSKSPLSPQEREGEEEGGADKLRQVTAEASKDLEAALSQLSESIDDLTTDQPPPTAIPTRPSEPPHFTLASSPTHRKGEDSTPPREPH